MQLLMPELKSMNFYRQTSKERKKRENIRRKEAQLDQSHGVKKKQFILTSSSQKEDVKYTLKCRKDAPN